MKLKIFRISSVVLLLAVMVTVFCFSSQVADDSQRTSEGFAVKVISFFYPKLKTMTEAEVEKTVESVIVIIRKLAHFSIFGLMGVFAFLSLVSYRNIKYSTRCIISFAICVIYSISDEIHQFFVEGRSCELRDVLIDSSGAFLAIALMSIACLGIKKIREKIL